MGRKIGDEIVCSQSGRSCNNKGKGLACLVLWWASAILRGGGGGSRRCSGFGINILTGARCQSLSDRGK